MTHEEVVLENFKKAAHKIFAENAPWLPKGANLMVDVDKYTAYKNDLANKVMAISAPDIDDKTKTLIIEGLKNELDEFVRNSSKS